MLKRVMEHFVAAVWSQSQNRFLDAVRIVVSGAMAAIADALLRYECTDHRSPLCEAFAGRLVDKGRNGTFSTRVYGSNSNLFAKQAATTLMTSPELVLTKTRVIDYFAELNVSPKSWTMSWEMTGYTMEVDEGTSHWLRTVIAVERAPQGSFEPSKIVSGRGGEDIVTFRYPEFVAYRDITFYWKYFLIPIDEACKLTLLFKDPVTQIPC